MAQLKEIPIELLHPMKTGQPRHHFDVNKLQELAASFYPDGILQPIVVRVRVDGEYEIIAGERRWRAAQIATLDKVPCLVKEESEVGSIFMAALTENIQREDLTPLEEAIALESVKKELRSMGHKGTQAEIAKKVSKGRDWVVKTMSILSLCDQARTLFRDYPEDLNKGHGYALQGLEDGHQISLIDEILEKNLSVRAVEKKAMAFKNAYRNAPPDYSSDTMPDMKSLTDQIEETTGCVVRITVSPKSNKHEIIFQTWGAEAFEGFIERLGIPQDV